MEKSETLKKYEQVLKITLDAIERGEIENIGTPHNPHYLLLKKYSPELAFQVLIISRELSWNKKEDLIEKKIEKIEPESPQPVNKLNLFQKIIKTLFNGAI